MATDEDKSSHADYEEEEDENDDTSTSFFLLIIISGFKSNSQGPFNCYLSRFHLKNLIMVFQINYYKLVISNFSVFTNNLDSFWS